MPQSNICMTGVCIHSHLKPVQWAVKIKNAAKGEVRVGVERLYRRYL